MVLSEKQPRAKQITFAHDPLWDAVPVIGTEGLIAIVQDEEELIEKLKESKISEMTRLVGKE